MRFLAELRCEKLRPELFRLTERLDYQDPSPRLPLKVILQMSPKHGSQMASDKPQNRTHWRVASRSLQPRRHANRWAAPSLPPILMVLFGVIRFSNSFRSISPIANATAAAVSARSSRVTRGTRGACGSTRRAPALKTAVGGGGGWRAGLGYDPPAAGPWGRART